MALKAGYYYGETAEIFTENYEVEKAQLPAGKYRGVSGNEATALGLLAASELSGLDLFGSYPITPASDILHYLSKQKHLGVKTFQKPKTKLLLPVQLWGPQLCRRTCYYDNEWTGHCPQS